MFKDSDSDAKDSDSNPEDWDSDFVDSTTSLAAGIEAMQ